jgi:hypothetical protein
MSVMLSDRAATEKRIRSLRWDGPAPGLKKEILSAAAGIHVPVPTLAERVWASRPTRLAWAAAFAGLVGMEMMAGSPAPARVTGPGPAVTGPAQRQLAREIGLPNGWARSLLARPGVAGGPNDGATRLSSSPESLLEEHGS